ncbi:ABC transporter permease [Flexivirga caeni]|uniref:ABC transporter permease n=1 Tax=Flexivirga caeni TaxID=2294115 RepID=A0A3M9MFA0_9MICO|nr:ABC transporter permease [Flexivirga caeni]RNI24229.1 ABC transporter permease [Flexivirga caeni]
MWDFVVDRREQLLINAWNHAYLVILAVLFATVIAVVLAVVVTRLPKVEPVANAVSAAGLTIPSFALIGLLLPVTGLGDVTALVAVTFYAVLPILRNAIVGLQGVEPGLVESARGMGMSEPMTLLRIKLPLAWPVILSGIRVSLQMSMGVAAIAAYVLGPGLGAWIFQGLTQVGGKNAVNYALSATIGIVLLALILDLALLLVGRLTTSKGVRV